MNVSQLIEILQQKDPNSEVGMLLDGGDYYDIHKVGVIQDTDIAIGDIVVLF